MGTSVIKIKPKIQVNNQPRLCSHVESRILENIILIWLDSNISENDEDTQRSLDKLRSIIDVVKIFTNIDECANFFDHIKDETVYMIVSGTIGEQFVPRVKEKSQLVSIYVYCGNKLKHELWAKNYEKVKGVFTQTNHVYLALQRDIQKHRRILAPIHSIASSSITGSNELEPSFMYSQLLKEILLEMEYDDKAKKDFSDFCRIQYANNDAMLHVIDEFERDYDCSSAIWWYTRTCFIYSVLNKALRTQDHEIIIMMGFIVRDLHRQIENLHTKSQKKKLLTVYRGQGMSHVEFDKIRNNQGSLISFHSFLSTSIDRQLSLAFAESARDDPDLISILFQMTIDPSISSTPFVALDGISYYSNKEKEFLFSMNTIFRIDNIEKLDDRLWEVQLTLSSNNDEQLERLTHHIRQEIKGSTALERLGNLMFKMDEFDKAEKLFQTLLTLASNNDWAQSLYAHYHLGYINNGRNNLAVALFHYNKSAEFALAHRPSTDPQLFGSYSNIGVILHKQGDLNEALKHFQLAIDVELHVTEPNQLGIASRQTNMGSVFRELEKFEEAIQSYERALTIQRVHLPPRHPLLAETYKHLASLYYLLKNYSKALFFYEKVLEIQQRSLPPNDSSLAETHNHIATILEDLGRYKEAIDHIANAVGIARLGSSSNRFQIQNYEQYHEHLLKNLDSMSNSTDDSKD